jgi:D-lactate dehydrogenase
MRAFFELSSEDKAILGRHLDMAADFTSDQPFDPAMLAAPAQCSVLSVFVNSRLNRANLEPLANLKLIATRSTGYDHIDIDYCRSRGIDVCNVPVYGDNTVAEHTFALILALSRKVIQAHNRARSGDFALTGLQGFDLRNRTIGVVGTGHIGVHVIRIARGFMMRAVAFDAQPDKRLADALDFAYVETLDELLAQSDIVTLHAPLVPSTHHMINRHNIDRMRPGSLLINTARGGLIETDAVVAALASGHLGGAGLDVFEGETLIREEKELLSDSYNLEELRTLTRNLALFRHENVIVTPHVAFNSVEALERILTTTASNTIAFERGKPANLVSAG